MARRRRIASKSYEERIAAVNAEIESLQVQLKEKKTEVKELIEAKEAEDQKKIMDAVKASGKSLEEVLKMITSSTDSEENDAADEGHESETTEEE